MKADSYIEEVEKCTNLFKVQIEEEQREIKDTQERVLNLLSEFFTKGSNNPSFDSFHQMKISLPNKSVIGSLFKNDAPSNDFFFSWDRQEKRRRQLAEERKVEYNAYLEEKEKEIQSQRHIPKENRTITPRSILDSVDYEKVLARLKEEEAKFRNLNHAEPNVEERISKSATPLQTRNPEIHSEEMKPRQIVECQPILPKATTAFVPFVPLHRTGGGGEPVRDSLGNMITARGFKDTSATGIGFPSFMHESSVSKSTYREELRKQIEEKKRLEALEKEKARELEEQIARRIEEQNRRMQFEYEKELMRDNQKKAKLQQERLQMLEEFQKKDAAIRNQKSKEIIIQSAPTLHVEPPFVETIRSKSPPVPAVRTKEILEKSLSPVSVTQVKPENVFSSIAEIRRSIMRDHQNLKKDFKDSYEVTNRRTVPDMTDDYEEDLSFH